MEYISALLFYTSYLPAGLLQIHEAGAFRYQGTPGSMAYLEHRGFRSFLCSPDGSLHFRGKLVYLRCMAVHYCCRCSSDTSVRQKNTPQESAALHGYTSWHFPHAVNPSDRPRSWQPGRGSTLHCYCRFLVSSWEQENDGCMR